MYIMFSWIYTSVNTARSSHYYNVKWMKQNAIAIKVLIMLIYMMVIMYSTRSIVIITVSGFFVINLSPKQSSVNLELHVRIWSVVAPRPCLKFTPHEHVSFHSRSWYQCHTSLVLTFFMLNSTLRTHPLNNSNVWPVLVQFMFLFFLPWRFHHLCLKTNMKTC